QKGAKGVVMRITKAFADLRQQIHDDLRRQHPEWVLSNGESPMCDAYEARLMELLEPSAPPLSLRGGKRPSKWRLNLRAVRLLTTSLSSNVQTGRTSAKVISTATPF